MASEKVYTFEIADGKYPMQLDIDLAEGFYMTDSDGTALPKNDKGYYEFTK